MAAVPHPAKPSAWRPSANKQSGNPAHGGSLPSSPHHTEPALSGRLHEPVL